MFRLLPLHHCRILLCSLALTFVGCELLPQLPKPEPVAPVVEESEDPAVTAVVAAALKDSKVSQDDAATYYGIFFGMSKAVRQAEIKTTTDMRDLFLYSGQMMDIPPGKYPKFSAAAGSSLDKVFGNTEKTQAKALTDDNRTAAYKTLQAIAVACRQYVERK